MAVLAGDRPLRVLAVVSDRMAEVAAALGAALDGSGPALLLRPDHAAGAPDPVGPGSPPPATVAPRVALVVETSGSTGFPKRVALSAEALVAAHTASTLALGGAGQWLLTLPLHYIAGAQVLIRSILDGSVPQAMPPGPFTADGFVQATGRGNTASRRYTSLVPVQLARILEHPDGPDALRQFSAILVGGQRLPAPLADRAAQAGAHIVRTYGSSETAGGCVYNGVPFDGVQVHQVDGEIALSGPVLAEGYLGDDALTHNRFVDHNGERLYLTGDTGTVAGGQLTVTGRRDRVLISGGTNVSIDRLESVLRDHPHWAEVVVVAADDSTWGQVPVVVSVTDLNLTELRAIAAASIGRAAQPAAVVRVPSIPLTPSGKPDHRALTTIVAREYGRS